MNQNNTNKKFKLNANSDRRAGSRLIRALGRYIIAAVFRACACGANLIALRALREVFGER